MMRDIFPIGLKLFWFGAAVSMFLVPTTTAHIVILGLASSIIVVQEWLNSNTVNQDMIDGMQRYQDAVNARVAMMEESVEGLRIHTRKNIDAIAQHREELSRLQTTANFKELN